MVKALIQVLVASLLNSLNFFFSIDDSIPCDIQCKDYPIFQHYVCYFFTCVIFTIHSYLNLLHPNVGRIMQTKNISIEVGMNNLSNHLQHLN